MKKYLLLTLLLGTASIAYAGGSCCDKGGEKPEKDTSTDQLTETSIILAGDCDEKCDKDGKKTDKSTLYETSVQLAGSGCSDSGCGGDKADKAEKTDLEATSIQFAGDSCSGDKDGKKCGDKKLHASGSVLA